MVAKEGEILELLGGRNKCFYIPVYQRKYSWMEKHCIQLIQDIKFAVNNNLKTHFLGSIVYHNTDIGGISVYSIIDGQQRITTISLLLLAIANVVNEKRIENVDLNNEDIISTKEIIESYFYINPYKKNLELKLKLTDEDSEYYRDLVLNNHFSNENNIGRNYSYFYETLKDLNFSVLKSYYNVITHFIGVNVSLASDDDPQRIFESLNSKNLALEESDKIRNFIFMKVDYDEQKILYNDYWKKITNNVEDVSKLIRFYLVLKTNEFVPENQLYYKFKDFMNNNQDINAKNVLQEILKYSGYMNRILNYSKNSKLPYQQSLYRLNKLDMSTIYPLVFICMDALVDNKSSNNEINSNDFDEIMMYIESFIVRRNFLKLSTSPLNKIFAFMPTEVYKLLEEGNSLKEAILLSLCNKTANSRFPKDAEFKSAFSTFELYNAKSPFRKYVLERLENYNHKEIIDVDNDISTGKLTIEHVMPQTLDEAWREYLGPNYEIIHQKYIDTIGNLTLTGYNSEYSNLIFIKKKTLPDKGFNYSSLYLNEYIKTQDEWGEKQINERALKLLDRAIEIWQYPSLENTIVFDILNPNTWKNVKITQFGREAFEYLLDNKLLTPEEVESFKDKAQSKLLVGAYYPVFSVTHEKGPTGKCHWAKKLYSYNGEDLYLTYEWFEEQFDLLSAFVKSKIK